MGHPNSGVNPISLGINCPRDKGSIVRILCDYSSRVPNHVSEERTGRPGPLLAAVVITALSGLLLVGLAAVVMAQGHGHFSLGVGLSLLMYGALVGGIAWLGWRTHPLAYGPMMAVNVLHGCVIASTALGSQAWWLWLGLVPVVAAILCLLNSEVRQKFGRGARRP